jgi:hypothetical protein
MKKYSILQENLFSVARVCTTMIVCFSVASGIRGDEKSMVPCSFSCVKIEPGGGGHSAETVTKFARPTEAEREKYRKINEYRASNLIGWT